MMDAEERKRTDQQEAERASEEAFAELFRDAFHSHPSPEYGPRRPLDLSFLEKEKKKIQRRGRLAKIAAAFLLLFLTSSMMAVWISSNQSLAFNHPFEKILHHLTGGSYTTDPSSTGREEKSQTIRITDPEQIDSALRLMPQMYVPEYLPEGWEMESLEVTRYTEGSCRAIFVYINSAKERVQIDEISEKGIVSNTQEPGEVIRLQNREVQYYSGETTIGQKLLFIENDVLVQIIGGPDKDELLQIADQMRQAE